MIRKQHLPQFSVDSASLQHFIIDKVTVKEDITETNTKGCVGDECMNVDACSESRTIVKKKSTTTVFKPPVQLRIARPEDRLPIAFADREQALLASVTEMRNLYREKRDQQISAEVITAQLDKMLTRYNNT